MPRRGKKEEDERIIKEKKDKIIERKNMAPLKTAAHIEREQKSINISFDQSNRIL